MKRKKSPLTPLGSILQKTLHQSGVGEQLKKYQLWDMWSELVGQAIAEHARPKKWRGRILIVEVENSVWMQELAFMSKDILSKIRMRFPDVVIDRLHFELSQKPS